MITIKIEIEGHPWLIFSLSESRYLSISETLFPFLIRSSPHPCPSCLSMFHTLLQVVDFSIKIMITIKITMIYFGPLRFPFSELNG